MAKPSAFIDIADTSHVSFSGNTVTIDPTADFSDGGRYSLLLHVGYLITDLAGNRFAGNYTSDTLNFTVADTIAPMLLYASPADNAGHVAVGAHIVLSFSEPVHAGTGDVEIHDSSNDAVVASVAVTDTSKVHIADNISNGDGKSDILWQNDSGQAMAWFMNGTTVVETYLWGIDPGPSWHLDWA